MIRTWGSCFVEDYFTTEDIEDNFSSFSFNRKVIDVSLMTSDDLMKSLYTNNEKDKNKDCFIEALFVIMSFTYDPMIKVDHNIKSFEVREFFHKTVLGKGELKELLKKKEFLKENELLKEKEVVKSSTIENVDKLNIKICELKEKNDKLEYELKEKKYEYEKIVFEKDELNAENRYLSEQLERKRKFCSDHHESKMVGKKQITDLSEF